MSEPDRAASLGFAEAPRIGHGLCVGRQAPDRLIAAIYLDYADDGTPLALFHVARHDPLVKAADGVTPWVLAVNGADAYVTPDWYVSMDQVPTWLYQAVHLTGPVRALSDEELRTQVDTLSARFEHRLLPKKPWTSGKMTPGRFDAMRKAIVGLSMKVEDIEGSFKLNQQKSEADYAAIATALSGQTGVAPQRLWLDETRGLRSAIVRGAGRHNWMLKTTP